MLDSLIIYISLFLYAFFCNSLVLHPADLENCDWPKRLSVEVPVEQNAKMPPCQAICHCPHTRELFVFSCVNGVYCTYLLIQLSPSSRHAALCYLDSKPPGWGQGEMAGTLSQSQLLVIGNLSRASNCICDKMACSFMRMQFAVARISFFFCMWSASQRRGSWTPHRQHC